MHLIFSSFSNYFNKYLLSIKRPLWGFWKKKLTPQPSFILFMVVIWLCLCIKGIPEKQVQQMHKLKKCVSYLWKICKKTKKGNSLENIACRCELVKKQNIKGKKVYSATLLGKVFEWSLFCLRFHVQVNWSCLVSCSLLIGRILRAWSSISPSTAR